MSFNPSLPRPQSDNWRENYGFSLGEKQQYQKNREPLFTTYQAPGGTPVPFIFGSVRLSGGQSVDTAEYPFFGFWSNDPLNEKPHTITVTGFIRGEGYIKNRNSMVEALRIKTGDDTPGFLDLPLWGRFPVVVASYDVEEEGKEAGQCAVTLTLTRAGLTAEERQGSTGRFGQGLEGRLFEGRHEGSTTLAAEQLEEAAAARFEKTLRDSADTATLAASFTELEKTLAGVAGRIQGDVPTLNVINNKTRNITGLIARGIRLPRELAQALIAAAAGIVTGIMEIKNNIEDTLHYFIRNNVRNILLQFLFQHNYRTGSGSFTVKERTTDEAAANLYRTVSLCSAARLIVQLESPTYQQRKTYWALYERLEASVNREDPEIYRAVEDLRIALAGELAARSPDMELTRYISAPVPLLYLAHYLGCDNEKVRRLNRPADSFVMQGDIIYV
ncbi:MAG: DNA circularization N-terminal domain-containing protein [Treponema sp.]|jgi:prophage DNA circulation protein|nr:DNA circularization N-terminal domain-containing protein [Treponema sp.]